MKELNTSVEEWREVPGYEGFYEASNFGRIRSVSRNVRQWRGGVKPVQGRILKQVPGAFGYLAVSLSRQGKVRRFSVHRIIAMTFHGTSPSQKHYALHRNDKRTDNRAENLYWGTQKENRRDARKNGLDLFFGSKNNKAKFTEEQVAEIRRQHATGEYFFYQLAAEYGVATATIHAIVLRRTWKHVP
jgi:hypothetical protein